MKINESNENYLETILILEENNQQVRMSDIAKHLNVSKPSVNKAMSILKEEGYILQQKYGSILLTEEGRNYATKVYERHSLFLRFFTEILKIDEDIAEEDACHVEHCISDITMESLKKYLNEVLDNQDK